MPSEGTVDDVFVRTCGGPAKLKHNVVLEILSTSPSVDEARMQLPSSYYESIAPFVNTEVERILNSGARILGNSSLLTRMPQTVGDSRLSHVKVGLDLIRIVLEHYLPRS